MGFFDVLRGGSRKLKQPAPDRLFAMSTAGVTMDTGMGLKSAGKAAIVFQPLATSDFDGIVEEMEEVLAGTGEETGTTIDKSDDEFGYRWMVLSDPDLEDLVVGVNAISSALVGGGYGDRVLCAVFAFRDDKRRSTGSTTTSAALLPVRPRAGRAAARLRGRAAAEGADRRRAADRARARALVPPLGHPDLAPPRGVTMPAS